MNILIETFDGLGDVIMSLPVAKYYYSKGARVDYVVKLANVDLFKNILYVRSVYNSNHKLKSQDYDKWFILSGKLSGYGDDETQRDHRTDVSFRLCGIAPLESIYKKPELSLSKEEELWACKLIDPTKINIVYSPIAQSRYRTYYFHKELLDLIDNNPEFNVIFTYKSSIKAQIKGTNLTGQTNLRQFISLVKVADVVFSVDTGTIQIAGSFDTPTLALFTTIPPDWRIRYFINMKALLPSLQCCPCWDMRGISSVRKAECVNSDIVECTNSISSDQVYKELLEFVFNYRHIIQGRRREP